MNIKVGTTLELTSLGTNNYAKGICKLDSFLVFVDDLYEGEIALVEITEVHKTYAFGKIVNLLKKSKHRIDNVCAHDSVSSTCPFNDITLDYENKIKADIVKNNIEHALNIDLGNIKCINPEVTSGYRNKVTVFFDMNYNYGYFIEKTHNISKISSCVQISEDIIKVLDVLKESLKNRNIEIYDYKTKRGYLKGVSIRRSTYNNKMSIMLLSTKNSLLFNDVKNDLVSSIDNISGVSLSIIDKDTTVVYGKEVILYGNNYIDEKILDNIYRINNQSFLQVNTKGAELIYSEAIKMASLNKSDVALDLYCGAGGISLSISKYVREVIGIEVVKDSIISANYNKEINSIDNVSFYCDDAENFKSILNNKNIDVLFVDPPRSGLSPKTIDSIISINPSKIVYVSCDPYTLSRDLKLLSNKYEIKVIKCVNSFMRTRHVESVCLLTKKDKK